MTGLFEGVLVPLMVRLEITAHVLGIAEGGTYEVTHNLRGGNDMVSTMAHYADICGLPQCLIVSLVSGWMGHGGTTGECLRMVTARAGN
jgi:hypothetical protein